MNKLLSIALATMTICFAACAQKTPGGDSDSLKINNTDNMEKQATTLVAYFSATGTTERAAKNLAAALDADIFEIVPAEPYSSADLDWNDKKSRSTIEMNDKACRPAIATKVENMAQYDTIYLGFPIWWYTAPRIINTFLESYNLDGKTVIIFATSGGSRLDGYNKHLQSSAPKANIVDGFMLNGNPSVEEIRKKL